jgi:very-short-patch-repair endonuclease
LAAAIDWVRSAVARDAAPRTYAQLRQVAGRTAIDGAIARGDLVRLLPNQYCLAAHSESWLMRAHAAVAWAGPRAALSGQAALAAWQYAPIPVGVIDVVVPAGGHRRGPSWLRVRSLTAPYRTFTVAPNTALVDPALALTLGYGSLPPRERANFVHGAIHRGLTTAGELETVLSTLPRVRDRAELAQRVQLIAAGAESYLEERAMSAVLRGKAFSEFVFQHRVRINGVSYRIDAFHPPTLTAFEMDGAGHGEPAQRQYDVTRDAAIAAIGMLTVRYTFNDIISRPRWCQSNALEVIAARRNKA